MKKKSQTKDKKEERKKIKFTMRERKLLFLLIV